MLCAGGCRTGNGENVMRARHELLDGEFHHLVALDRLVGHAAGRDERGVMSMMMKFYSARNASSGSTRVALRAGARHATTDTPSNRATVAEKITGSVGVIS
jgi:hypothetical protein